MRTVTVFEQAAVVLADPPGPNQLHPDEADLLLELWQENAFGQMPQRGKTSLRFFGVCGLIGLGDVQIEILPHISKDAALDRDRSVAVLVQMLRCCPGLLKLAECPSAFAIQANHPLFEVLIEKFVEKLEREVGRGLLQTYHSFERVLASPRGKLQIASYLCQVRRDRYPVRYSARGEDHRFNRAIRYCLTKLLARVEDLELASRVRNLLTIFAEVGREMVTHATVRKIKLGREQARWRPIQRWLEWFLREATPTPSAGAESGFSLLFQMNAVFEAFNQGIFQRLASEYGLVSVKRERQCLARSGNLSLNRIRPDHLFARAGQVALIGDSKWKLLKKAKPSTADVYQMYAYAVHLKGPEIVMFYPALGQTGHSEYHFTSHAGRLHLVHLDLSQLAESLEHYLAHVRMSMGPILGRVSVTEPPLHQA